MSKKLVIVESPSKAKTISKYLGKNYFVESTVGHIKDLPKTTLGIDLDENYSIKLQVIRGKSDVVKKLKSSASKVDEIYIATDPDREGEAIAMDVYDLVNSNQKLIKRVLFNEITQKGIRQGMADLKTIDKKLVDSQRARRVMDRIIGYKVSPLLWNHLVNESREGSLSAGRVQSVALRIICEREEEINKFNPLEYWSIVGIFKTQKNEEIHSKLFSIEKKNWKIPENLTHSDTTEFQDSFIHIRNESEASGIVEDCKKHNYSISNIDKKIVNRYPGAPFTTSTLQQEASKKLGYRPRQTMQYAQKLYEGVEIGKDGFVGLITYMRTDSTRVSNESVTECRDYITKNYGLDYLPNEGKNYIRKKSNVQDAHEAIRPTDLNYTPSYVKPFLSKEMFRLYELIWKRFIACQMNPALFEQTSIDIEGGKYLFRANGMTQIFKGYLAAYEDEFDQENMEEDKDAENEGLPQVNINENVALSKIIPNQHFTKPPARFSESTLVKELDNLGIGRPSTYASIIGTLYDRNYVSPQDKRLYPSDLGIKVNSLLVKYFDHIFNVNFTAQMEKELDDVEEGENSYLNILNDFYLPFKENLENVEKHFEKTKCEKCGSDMEIKMGRFGRFLACTNYPNCKNIKSLKAPQVIENAGEKCPKCGNALVYRNSKFGKFLGCSNYPDCDYKKSISLDISCPKCSTGQVVQKASKRGKIFFGCNRYPDCDYANWDKPNGTICPNCGKDYLIEKRQKNSTIVKCNSCNTIISQENIDE